MQNRDGLLLAECLERRDALQEEGEEILEDYDAMEKDGKVRVVFEEDGTPTPFVFAAALEAVAEARGVLSDLDTINKVNLSQEEADEMQDLRHCRGDNICPSLLEPLAKALGIGERLPVA